MADDLALVLELLHGSPGRWRTLRAEGEEWVDEELSGEAFLRSGRRNIEITRRGARDAANRDPNWKAWVQKPDRSRAEFGGAHQTRMTTITDGPRVWTTLPGGREAVVRDRPDDALSVRLGPAGALVDTAVIPGVLELEVLGPATVLGRDAIVVVGRPSHQGNERVSWAMPLTRGADAIEMAVDVERGVLLSREARLGGVPFHRVTLRAVAFDEVLDDALFSFPDAGAPRRAPSVRPRVPPPARRFGPPDGVLGRAVAVDAVLARTETVVVAVDRVIAYPGGFELGVTVRSPDQPGPGDFSVERPREWQGAAAFPGESIRFGVEFADGRRAVVDNFGISPATPGGLTLVALGGGGTKSRADQRFWVTPLPPPGRLGLIVAWTSRDVPETTVDIDAGAIIEAAGRADTLWP